MRKTYGNTWWGKQWLNALNNIDYSNRLPRGKTYANKGNVYEIQIIGNKIKAIVKGSRRYPYDIAFTIPSFSAQEKATIIQTITANPLYLSQLLNRKLPTDLYRDCERAGIHIFPNSWHDITGGCSCPDHAVPCKHMAATLYIVANEIDKNPFLVFDLHDFDLFKGLEGIGYTTAAQKDISITSTSQLYKAFSFDEQAFKWQDDLYQKIDFSRLPNNQENLLAILSENPVFYTNGDFKDILKRVYTKISKQFQKIPKVESNEAQLKIMDNIEDIELLLDNELDFLNCTFRNSRSKSLLTIDNEEDLIAFLEQVPLTQLPQYTPSLKALHLAYRTAYHLAKQAAFIPQLLEVGPKRYKVRWIPASLNPQIKALTQQVRELIPRDLLFYKQGRDIYEPKEHEYPSAILSVFLTYFVNKFNSLDYRYQINEVSNLFFNGDISTFKSFENKTYPVAIQLWLNNFYLSDKDFIPVLQIDEDEGWFTVQITVENKNKPLEAPIALEDVLKKEDFSHTRIDVLRDLAMLSDYFPQISRIVASQGRESLSFDAETFVDILFKIVPTIRLFGIKVLLPKALRRLFRPQVSLALETDDGAVKNSSIIGLNSMLSFNWQVAVGDQMLSPEEFLKMVKKFSGIVKLNDQYVFFDEKEIQNLIQKLENPPVLDHHQLLQTALTEEYEGAKIELDSSTRKLIKQLLNSEAAPTPDGLKATLRPYQLNGYEWLYKNAKIGFGSLIADDMGLGKTLQVIATLLKLKEEGAFKKAKALVIVPTTLLTNWRKEIAKFAPNLKTHLYHGSNRKIELLEEADVLLTTYGVIRSETTKLQKKKWLLVVIDEAQNIKNPSTAQTKAVKKIKAPIKIAMSGTPVENRLSEYWSIFDFTNKGYLSTLSKFKDRFARPIEIDRDQEQLDKFRKITAPFILRRLKSDKSIIKDLPDKVEQDQFCELTKEQAAIYQNVIDTTLQTIENAEGINRRGLILKLITALKQICNHPRHFLKKGDDSPVLSGKSRLLFDLMPKILEAGEKTLIFTQYQEMGNLLVQMLEEEFNFEVPFLHGGVSRKGRDEMVEQFQNDRATRVMILSLKAGGTGLNLTAASNVIHYDLWWNPAVEAQATDRAYRIGQTRNVFVHRFITQGTFEEKINKLLQDKKELANLAVSTGEKWIGELSNSELNELVRLS